MTFSQTGHIDGQMLPGELFDSVADNLLQNALKKRGMEPELQISVQFSIESEGGLCICDNGSCMASTTAAKLFDAPVASQSGLGIGLYQAARQAEQLGYELRLSSNEMGHVCFELKAGQMEAAPQ